ncbi:MAG: glycoside hydrolase family 130 protein [Fimbriimonas sp.]|nr:glycoside hydrolase family 130 protein [Fimbriimonas sp.]
MLTLIFLSTASWTLGPFSRTSVLNPILGPNPAASFSCPMRKSAVAWEHDHVFNPAAISRNGEVYVLYRAEDNSGSGIGGHTSRVGLADSFDGVHFAKRKTPVLFPSQDIAKRYEWTGGCEDPRVVQSVDGTYVLTYTAWDRSLARLCVATSKDLVHWKKNGPAFAKTRFLDTWSKSGSIVTKLFKNRLIATKVDGKYWMYWGEGTLKAATSTNLIDWKPLTDDKGNLVEVLKTRPGKFDSELVEPGPPAVLTSHGIVLIYNAKNAEKDGDRSLGTGAYAAGQALFDRKQPNRLVNRTQSYFLKPELPCEVTGQYKAGTVFTEGLAVFKGRWFLYYGCGDSYVGVAATK